MPLFDFCTPTLTSKVGIWIYWAVTAPLTISILTIYLTNLARVERKHREEDKIARDDVPQNKHKSSSPTSEETRASRGMLGLRSMFSIMLSYNLLETRATTLNLIQNWEFQANITAYRT
jgi:hypothetical protein